MLAPVGGQRSFHDDGELAGARAAKVGNHLQIMSTMTSHGVEEVTKARGAPIWLQLYATNKFEVAKAHHPALRGRRLHRPSRSRSTAAAGAIRKRRSGCGRATRRDCTACHDRTSLQTNLKGRAMFQGLDISGLRNTQSSAMNWDYLKRIRDITKMKVLVKGILAWEDAVLAADAGLDGIIVSNHGARSED